MVGVIDLAVAIACKLEERWEGFSAEPYLCPAGVPTIGFGFTHYADGRPVTLSDPPMTREAARELLVYLTRTKYLPTVLRLCPGIDTPERLGAITDFCFNLGEGNLRTSTLRRKINARKWDAVPDQLRRWTRANGRVLRGLVLRREAEAQYI